MRIRSSTLTLLAGLVLSCAAVLAHAQAREEGRLLIASEVLEDLRATPDKSIPDRLLERAYAIAVIPDMTKLAFFARRPTRQRRSGRARQQGPLQQPAIRQHDRRQLRLAVGRAVDRYRAGVHHRARGRRASPAARSLSARMPRWPQAPWGAWPPRRRMPTSRPRSIPTRAIAAPSSALLWTARHCGSTTTRTRTSTRSRTCLASDILTGAVTTQDSSAAALHGCRGHEHRRAAHRLARHPARDRHADTGRAGRQRPGFRPGDGRAVLPDVRPDSGTGTEGEVNPP